MARRRLNIVTATSGPGWSTAWRGRDRQARLIVDETLRDLSLRVSPGAAVEVEFSTDAAVQVLNRRFRGKDKPTNVLSFPNPSQPIGSIVLAFETIQREANAQNKGFIQHAKHMILHGFLHLNGYDHEIAKERRLMEAIEIRILAGMGVPNPYLLAQ